MDPVEQDIYVLGVYRDDQQVIEALTRMAATLDAIAKEKGIK